MELLVVTCSLRFRAAIAGAAGNVGACGVGVGGGALVMMAIMVGA